MSITLSIVSHGQGSLVAELLSDLSDREWTDPIILTLNIPEDENFLSGFERLSVDVIRNTAPKGFGTNHNAAFAQSSSPLFAVVNPDIRLTDTPICRLAECFGEGAVGACGPAVYSPTGQLEDSVRRFPTIVRLFSRRVLGRRQPDYAAGMAGPVDWLAGMLIVFRSKAFAGVGGFDENYFMYMEDADICRRLWRAGWGVQIVPTVRVVHAARRASHRSGQHLCWHLRSAMRFLTGW